MVIISTIEGHWKLKMWNLKNELHCINPKGKFILSPQEKRQWSVFKVLSDRLSQEIDILIQSSIPTLTELEHARLLTADRISMLIVTSTTCKALEVYYLYGYHLYHWGFPVDEYLSGASETSLPYSVCVVVLPAPRNACTCMHRQRPEVN